jgi:hypothetical protein
MVRSDSDAPRATRTPPRISSSSRVSPAMMPRSMAQPRAAGNRVWLTTIYRPWADAGVARVN